MQSIMLKLICWPLVLIFASMQLATAQTIQSPELVESKELTAKVVKLYREHKYDEALPLAKRALELADAALGKTDARLIGLLINLGDLYVATLHVDDAKATFEWALMIAETNFGVDDLHVTRPLDELGYLRLNKGEYSEAAKLFSRALAIKEKGLQSSDIEIARSARALADVYRLNREYSKAEQFYERAIRIYEQAGKKDAELVEALNRYLIVLTTENKMTEAASIRDKLATLSAEPGVVEGGVVNGWAVKLAKPEYPAIARGAHVSGQVAVQVLIDENGKVISASAISGHPLLQGAAIEAAKASKFTPTLRSGVAVKVRGTIIYNFIAQ